MEKQVRDLEINKLFTDSFLENNFTISGQWNFAKTPLVNGVPISTEEVVETQNLSTRSFINFGKNWSRKLSPNNEILRKWSYISNRGKFCAACEYGGLVYKSNDFGNTWMSLGITGNWACVSISVDGLVIAASEADGTLIVSFDGGLSWNEQDIVLYPGGSEWSNLFMTEDGQRLVIGGYRSDFGCNIYYTDNFTDYDNLGILSTYSVFLKDDYAYITDYNSTYGIYVFNVQTETPQPSIKPGGYDTKWVFYLNSQDIQIALLENEKSVWINTGNSSWDYKEIAGYPQMAVILGNVIIITTWEGPCYISYDFGDSFNLIDDLPSVYNKSVRGFIQTPTDESYYTISSYDNSVIILQSYGYIFASNNRGTSFVQGASFYDNNGQERYPSVASISNDGLYGCLISNFNIFNTFDGRIWNFSNAFTDYSKMLCCHCTGQYHAIGGIGYVLFSNDYGHNYKILRNDYYTYKSIFVLNGRILCLTSQGKLLKYSEDVWIQLYEVTDPGFMTVSNDFSYIAILGKNTDNPITRSFFFSSNGGSTFTELLKGIEDVDNAAFGLTKFYFSSDKTLNECSIPPTSIITTKTFGARILSFSVSNSELIVITEDSVQISSDMVDWFDSNLPEGAENLIFVTSSFDKSLIIDSKGKLYSSSDYGATYIDTLYVNNFNSQRSIGSVLAGSSSGQYMASITANKSLMVTINSGKSWFFANDIYETSFRDCAISTTGQYIVGVSQKLSNDVIYCDIYISSDFSKSFVKRQLLYEDVIKVCISGNGKYIVIISISGRYIYSSDYGDTFSSKLITTGTIYLQNLVISTSGKFQLITSLQGRLFFSKDTGKNFVEPLDPIFSVISAAMSSNGEFISLCCWVTTKTDEQILNDVYFDKFQFRTGTFVIMVSSNYGKSFFPSLISPGLQPYNIAMTSNGQYQVAATYGGIYVSESYGGQFNLSIKDSSLFINYINSIYINSEGTIIRLMDTASNIYECRPYEQTDMITNYSVSPVITVKTMLDGEYDVYQVTSDCEELMLPEIASLYPVPTRTITIAKVDNSNSDIKISASNGDKILVPGIVDPSDFTLLNIPYGNLQFMSNGQGFWFITNFVLTNS